MWLSLVFLSLFLSLFLPSSPLSLLLSSFLLFFFSTTSAYRVKFFDISSTQAPPPRRRPPEEEENENEDRREDEQSDSSLEEELEREREEEEQLMDRSAWIPEEKQFYSGRMIFHLSSDSQAIVIKPLPASERHDVKVFGMEEFVAGVSGKNVAFNTLEALEETSPRKDRKKKKKNHNEIGGGIRIKPSISLTADGQTKTKTKRKNISWTILAWIALPIKNTGRMHALLGGKNGEAHIVVADDAQTLGKSKERLQRDRLKIDDRSKMDRQID